MRILLDMNLAPDMCEVLRGGGLEAVHWSEIGDPTAPDTAIMRWARAHGYVVLTHDLDFSALLATTMAEGPSVVQIRTQDVLSESFRGLLLRALHQFKSELEAGAVVSVDAATARVRVLPLAR